jgi:molybdopterin converting factor small subunit
MVKMKVMVKLYATLRRFAPQETDIGDEFEVIFQGATIGELVRHLGFPLDQAKIVMVNGQRVTKMDFTLSDDDLIVIFPPVGGG